MFDITSWIRETIFRRPKLAPSIAGEELSEKQTTKMGYFLLFCMFMAIMSTAQWTLSIISDIPDKPSTLPTCVNDILYQFNQENAYTYDDNNSYYGYNYYGYNGCTLTSENPHYDFTSEYGNLQPAYTKLKDLINELSRIEGQKSNATYRQQNNREEYNTALTEKIAQEESGVYNPNQIKNDISTTRNEISDVEDQIRTTKQAIDNLRVEYAPQVSILKHAYDNAESAYKKAYLMYRMLIAALSLTFSGFIFAIFYKMYVRRKLENSPHTIIFSVATFAYGLVLLQVLLMFLWDVIPHRFLEWLLGIISVFTPILYLVQFLWPVVIVAVFGFLVYRIQKRLYSPQNIIKRFVTDKKCPNCGNAVDMSKPFCPLCAHEIHINCPSCHELTMKGMPYCSNCGTKLPNEGGKIYSYGHTLSDELSTELAKIDTTGITSVVFHLLDETSFVSKRETIIRLALYITSKLGKSTFTPKEFTPYLEKILEKVDKKGISQAELDRVLGKIRTWVEIGGSLDFQKK